jgi:hypothetical protein
MLSCPLRAQPDAPKLTMEKMIKILRLSSKIEESAEEIRRSDRSQRKRNE